MDTLSIADRGEAEAFAISLSDDRRTGEVLLPMGERGSRIQSDLCDVLIAQNL